MMFTNDLGLPNRTIPIALNLQKEGHDMPFCNTEAAPETPLAAFGASEAARLIANLAA